jgi:hypothetical protein
VKVTTTSGTIYETKNILPQTAHAFSTLIYVSFNNTLSLNQTSNLIWLLIGYTSNLIGIGRESTSPDKLTIYIKNKTDNQSKKYAVDYKLLSNLWYAIALTYNYDTKTLKCYINGKKVYENNSIVADALVEETSLNYTSKYLRLTGSESSMLNLKVWQNELTEYQIDNVTQIVIGQYSFNTMDSIQTNKYMEYPPVTSKNILKGSLFPDGNYYLLVLSESGLRKIDRNNQYGEGKPIVSLPVDRKGKLYRLFMQGDGNVGLYQFSIKTDGTVDNSSQTPVWNTGKAYKKDNIQRTYTMTLEGGSIIVRNMYGDVFYNSEDTNTLNEPVSCVKTQDNTSKWTPCSSIGKKKRLKYTITTAALYGGPCDNKDEEIEESCTNCVYTTIPNPTWTACTNEGQCGGVDGNRSRQLYKITQKASNGGTTCPIEYEYERCPSKPCPIPKDCIKIPTPSDDPWSKCDANGCDIGYQTRDGEKITSPALNGGKCDISTYTRSCMGSCTNFIDSIQSFSEPGKY